MPYFATMMTKEINYAGNREALCLTLEHSIAGMLRYMGYMGAVRFAYSQVGDMLETRVTSDDPTGDKFGVSVCGSADDFVARSDCLDAIAQQLTVLAAQRLLAIGTQVGGQKKGVRSQP